MASKCLTEEELAAIWEWAEENENTNALAKAYVNSCEMVNDVRTYKANFGPSPFCSATFEFVKGSSRWGKVRSVETRAFALRDYIGRLILEGIQKK